MGGQASGGEKKSEGRSRRELINYCSLFVEEQDNKIDNKMTLIFIAYIIGNIILVRGFTQEPVHGATTGTRSAAAVTGVEPNRTERHGQGAFKAATNVQLERSSYTGAQATLAQAAKEAMFSYQPRTRPHPPIGLAF